MGSMVFSLLWVMQGLYHQPYFAPIPHEGFGRSVKIRDVGLQTPPLARGDSVGLRAEGLGLRIWSVGFRFGGLGLGFQ